MPQKIVVDSSVILKWLYRKDESYFVAADELLKDAVEGKILLFAPELAKYEVGNVLLVAKKLSKEDGIEALDTFFSFPIKFVSDENNLSHDAYFIGSTFGITYYDASFAALAKQENATLVTDNPKHQAKIKNVKVLPLSKYR